MACFFTVNSKSIGSKSIDSVDNESLSFFKSDRFSDRAAVNHNLHEGRSRVTAVIHSKTSKFSN